MKKWMMCVFTVCLLAVALSVTAFAAETDGIQSVKPEKAGVSVSGQTSEKFTLTYSGAENGKQYLVVVSSDANKTLNENTIYYIDQVEAAGNSAAFNVYPKTLSDGNYYVYLSSNAATGVTTLEQVATITATGPAYKLGYIDDDDKITASDALCALQMSVGKGTWTDVQRSAANVDGDDKITASDALKILQAAVGKVTL